MVILPVCSETCFPSNINEPEMRTFSSFSSVSRHYNSSPEPIHTTSCCVAGASAVMVLEDGPRGREDREMVEQSKLIVDGKEYPAERILKNGVNYIKVRDLAAALGLKVGHKGSIAILERK